MANLYNTLLHATSINPISISAQPSNTTYIPPYLRSNLQYIKPNFQHHCLISNSQSTSYSPYNTVPPPPLHKVTLYTCPQSIPTQLDQYQTYLSNTHNNRNNVYEGR